MDVQRVVAAVNNHLQQQGFEPRDADGNDFANTDVPGLRFKTGTSYEEVAIQVWVNDKTQPGETIRVLNDGESLGMAFGEIDYRIGQAKPHEKFDDE